MNDHTLRTLEYHQLLDLIASYAATEPARERLRGLRPAARQLDAMKERDLYEAFVILRDTGITVRRVEFDSPEEALQRVIPHGAILDSEHFLILRRLLQEAEAVRGFLRNESCSRQAVLVGFAEATPDDPPFRERLDRTFDDKGNVQDRASDRLWEIRQSIRQLERRINQQLERLLQNADVEEAFHDKFVALRNNRYVVPVKRELKGRIKGVIHDQSNSGRTLFMEPELTLEDGNALATVRLEERDEIRRILAALSDLTRQQRHNLRQMFDQLVRYDMAYGVSSWAETYACAFPRFDSKLHLRSARHPLLLHQLREAQREEQLVPLDLELDPDLRVLAITGSNTGGKTIVLKTIGLLTLAAQSGLPVPVGPNSTLRFFPRIMADIGDEQSIAQSLSTFSGHLRNISAILSTAAEAKTLVLIDELGAGTDPIEGGALGCAILETLREHDALTFFTTHLGMIKSFVHDQEQMRNAHVRFNRETLQPEYVLEVGRPGASHALSIAERCGINGEVLAKARSRLSSDHLGMEEMLASIEEKERSIAEGLATAEAAREKALRERDELREELITLRKERKQLLHQAQREAGALVDNTRRQMENLLDKAKTVGKGEQAKELRQTIQRKRENLQKGAEETAPKVTARLKESDLAEGLRVWVPVLNDHGEILSLTADKKRGTINVGGKRFELKTNQLMPAKESLAKPTVENQVRVHRPASSQQVAQELNVIGLRVEEALPRVDRFLDEALLSGLDQVRIIHGFGTGQLRKGIHEHLAGNAVVLGFRLGVTSKDPGGGGATIVQLA